MDPKLQHYVPRLLLSRFADDREQVATYDLKEQRTFPQAYGNAAAETHFYRVENPEEEPSNEIERWLSEIETHAADAISHVVDDRAGLAALVAFQAARTRRTRDEIAAITDDGMKFLMAMQGKDGFRAADEGIGEPLTDEELDEEWRAWSDFDSWSVSPHHHDHLRIMGDIVRDVFPTLYQKRRLGVVNFNKRGLLISDQPIGLHSGSAPEHTAIGILNAEEIWLPVSRRAAIVFLDGFDRDVVLPPTTRTAQWVNTLVAHSARRWIYHHPNDRPLDDLLAPPTYRERPIRVSQDPRDWIPDAKDDPGRGSSGRAES